MANFNRVILMGNLTKDPELRYTPSGTAVANLRLAVNHRYRQDNELKEEVSFFDIAVFGKNGENCSEYLAKGRPVLVEGRLRQNRWETEDGQRRSRIEVVANNVRFLGGGPRGGEEASEREPNNTTGDENPPKEEDVPF